MITKLFEIRDRATFIPVLATKIEHETEAQSYLLRRCGFLPSTPYIFMCRINGGEGYADPYDWMGRTLQTAHEYMVKHWDELKDGDVIDVEFILGETKVKKVSERGTTV